MVGKLKQYVPIKQIAVAQPTSGMLGQQPVLLIGLGEDKRVYIFNFTLKTWEQIEKSTIEWSLAEALELPALAPPTEAVAAATEAAVARAEAELLEFPQPVKSPPGEA
jgi:hypothetical protein